MPNEQFDAWQEILTEWKRVRRMKRLVQELYDQVGGTLFFILEYAKKNNITLPNRDALYQMADRIHKQMDEIESFRSDENLQSRKDWKTDGELTEPKIDYLIYSITHRFEPTIV